MTTEKLAIKLPVEFVHELVDGSFRSRLFDADSILVAECDTVRQAEQIVLALNSNSALLAAAEGMVHLIKQNDAATMWRLINDSETVPEWRQLRAAIAKGTL